MAFISLLMEAQQLLNEISMNTQLLHLESNLDPIIPESVKQHKSRDEEALTKGTKANSWLLSKGIDLAALKEKVDNFKCDRLHAIRHVSWAEIAKEIKINVTIPLLEDINISNKEWDDLLDDWRKERVLLLNILTGPNKKHVDIFRREEKVKMNYISEDGTISIDTLFARAVIDCNREDCRSDLLERFGKFVELRNDDELNNCKEFWRVLVSMVSMLSIDSMIDPVKRRQDKQDEFINAAKFFLEKECRKNMRSAISANLAVAQCGGVPSIENLIKGFVTLYLNMNEITGLVEFWNGKPLWPHIYFAMRCGHITAILTFYKEFGSAYQFFFEAIVRKVNNPNLEINADLKRTLVIQYLNSITQCTDPFLKASYCLLLGHDEEEALPLVDPTPLDWIWTRLFLVRKYSKNVNRDFIKQVSYSGVQEDVVDKYGEDEVHIDNSKKQLVYFQLLILTGQFEAGIAFLARCKGKHLHAVHMAIALNELHLLSTPRDQVTPLLSVDTDDPQPMKRLNLTRLISRYLAGLNCKKYAIEAVNYLSFLRKFKFHNGSNVFVTYVCELALKSPYIMLFTGEMHPSGIGKLWRGLFDYFSHKDYSTEMLSTMLAEQLVHNGALDHAIYFFDLSGLHDKAIRVLITHITKHFHKGAKNKRMRTRLTETVIMYTCRLRSHSLNIEPETEAIFKMLSNLIHFFNLYYAREYYNAMVWLLKIHLVPLCPQTVGFCTEQFEHLPKEVSRFIPKVLCTAMKMLHDQSKLIKEARTKMKDMAMFIHRIHVKAKALLNMAVTIECHMPPQLYKNLTRWERSIIANTDVSYV